nr:hypothetical protein BHI3_07770 [Bacteriovorax sp. HI3]
MLKILMITAMILVVSCGSKESSDNKLILNSGLYGGTWRYDNGNVSQYLTFSGNQVQLVEEVSGVQVSDNTYTITPITTSKATVMKNGSPETWDYVVNGNSLNLCINSCVNFTR